MVGLRDLHQQSRLAPAPAKNSTDDLDRVSQKRSGVTARKGGLEEEERFSKAALGRDYQR